MYINLISKVMQVAGDVSPMEQIGLTIFRVLILAILVESIVETMKPLWDKTKGLSADLKWCLIISVIITVLAGQDLFSYVGIPLRIPGVDPSIGWHMVFTLVVGAVFTGVVISRGSNYIHLLINKLMGKEPGDISTNLKLLREKADKVLNSEPE